MCDLSGQYFTDDQMMNIYTFSMLYQWIYRTQDSLAYQRDGSEPRPIFPSDQRRESIPVNLIPQSSLDKLSQSASSDRLSGGSPSSVPKFGRTPSSEKLGGSPKAAGSVKQRSRTPISSPQRPTTPVGQQRAKTPVFEQKSLPFDRRGSIMPKTVFDALVGRSMDYCFRILDQCERSK